MVRAELEQLQVPIVQLNQRRIAATEISFEVSAGRVTGDLAVDEARFRLEALDAVYIRLMDEELLPEHRGQPEDSPTRAHSRQVHETLIRWCEVSPARVVNRFEPMGSNSSKPYQAQLIVEHGFLTPETLITNDPDLVASFVEAHPAVVYKSMSGVRSIVQPLRSEEMRRLEDIRWCPVQFQEWVAGMDVRVHTIGEEAFATAVTSDATDYRYAHREGRETRLEAMDLAPEVVASCISLTRSLGLSFAGIDLRMTPDGRVYCFEVNPSPAYSYYESHTGQPIARALATYLAYRRP
jgi:glutathione synthase/RimK-type ligase-like ATP-grasp enzyme